VTVWIFQPRQKIGFRNIRPYPMNAMRRPSTLLKLFFRLRRRGNRLRRSGYLSAAKCDLDHIGRWNIVLIMLLSPPTDHGVCNSL
jgi:hypothetical protein